MYRRLLFPLFVATLAAVLLAGCGAKDQMAELTANPWVGTQILTSDGLQGTLQGTSPAIFFNVDGTVRGNATVNVFTGPYTLEGRSVKIGPLAASQWDGPQMESAQDALVLDAFRSTARYHISDGVLELSDASGQLVMSLKVAPEPKLVGPVWKCTEYLSDKGALVSVIATSPVVASFAPDGTLAGSGGVNQYSAPYTAAGTKMTIGPEITTTKMAGPEPLMAQEAGYLAAIARTAAFKIEAYQLSLIDASGAVLANYTPLAPK